MLRLTALLFVIVPLSAHARCDGAPITDYMSGERVESLNAQADATPYGEGLYWQASKGDATIAILGTMHLPDPRHDAVLVRVLPRLNTADILLVEATLQDQTDMQIYMAQNAEMMTITDGPTLPELLDEQTWFAIRNAAQDRGIPVFMAAKMQPWFLNLSLAMPTCAMTAIVNGELGLDAMLMHAANAANTPVAPLEPWQDMLTLLSSGTFDEQVDALRMGIMDTFLQNAMIVSLTDSYFDGQTAFSWHLARYTLDFMPDIDPDLFEEQFAKLEELLLANRNQNWIPVIEAAAATHDNVFIGFGAAHLVGEDGVLNLLDQRGWTISQL